MEIPAREGGARTAGSLRCHAGGAGARRQVVISRTPRSSPLCARSATRFSGRDMASPEAWTVSNCGARKSRQIFAELKAATRSRRGPTTHPGVSPAPDGGAAEIIDIGNAPVEGLPPLDSGRPDGDGTATCRTIAWPRRQPSNSWSPPRPSAVVIDESAAPKPALCVRPIPATSSPRCSSSPASPRGPRAGYWLARQGHDVPVIERKTFPGTDMR